jgi:hypothetical protein
MANKAVCFVSMLAPSSTVEGACHVIVCYTGLAGGSAVGSFNMLNIIPDPATLVSEIKQALQDHLVTNHNYVFEEGDTIIFIGAVA